MVAAPLNPTTLPSGDNINDYSFCQDLEGQFFMQTGKMIAYYGQIKFEMLTALSVTALVAKRFSSPLYTQRWVVASGSGKLILGDKGRDINAFALEEGNLTVRAVNLLGFETTLQLKQSVIPGYLTLLGTGTFLASSNGPVMFADPPIRVDPQAILGWADCPSPSEHFDSGWMQTFLAAASNFLGRNSGEERQFDFTGAGTVLIQSSEIQIPGADTAVPGVAQR